MKTVFADTSLLDLSSDPRMDIEPASRQSFEAGCVLYESRPDKDWSLTDCISMSVMRDRVIHEALTADHHFRQAGFVTLMSSPEEHIR